MKHLVALFLPICIFSFLAFGVSWAVLGTNPNYSKNTITGRTTVITDTYSEIEVSSDAANVRIYPTNTNTTTVISEQEISETIKVNVDDGTLKIDCDAGFGFFTNPFDFIGSLFDGNKSTVTILVPNKQYDNIEIKINGGDTEVIDVASKNINLKVATGNLTFSLPENITANNIDVDMDVGECVFYNASTKNYNIDIDVGNVEMYELSGTGTIDIDVGDLIINYADLNGDISATLDVGSIKMNLPNTASANIHCKKDLGNVNVDFGNINTTMDNNSNVTIGDGKYSINTDISIGDIIISDNMENKEPPSVPDVPVESESNKSVITTAIYASSMPVPEDDTNVKVDVGDIRV